MRASEILDKIRKPWIERASEELSKSGKTPHFVQKVKEEIKLE